jgi:chromosome segregation ATPase
LAFFLVNRLWPNTARLQEYEALKSRFGNLDFSYSDPTPNFDRSKVKGLVVTLVGLPETSERYATALEVSAGGKLYNVVVEDETVGTQLLKKGNLRKRITIIPLNKINAFQISAEACSFYRIARVHAVSLSNICSPSIETGLRFEGRTWQSSLGSDPRRISRRSH